MRHTKKKHARLRLEELESRTLLSIYYVAPAGADAAAGSSQAPWQTLQHAANAVQAGDTVIVEAGNYQGFDLTTSGAPGAPITFQAQPGVQITSPNSTTGQDGINLEGASYVVIDGFTVTNMPRAGIRAVTDTNVTIKDNTTDHNGWWGIFTGFSNYVDIEHNTASNSQSQHGIYVSNSAVSPTIRDNLVFGNAQNGIHLNGDIGQGGTGVVTGALIEGNVIHDNGVNGGSAINGDGVQNSVIEDNLLYNNHANGISLYQINAAAPSVNNVVANNTIVMASDARWALNIQNGSTGNTVFNNILYNNNPANGSIDVSSDSLPGLVSDDNVVNNLFTPDGSTFDTLAQWQAITGQDTHSVVSTPAALFVNAAGNDYHLASSSPAIDKGVASLAAHTAPVTDLDGNARPSGTGYDIGAYELQQSGTTPTPTPTPTPTSSGPPSSFTSQGIGGGGSLYAPSIDPTNGNNLWLSSDMTTAFHSTDGGTSWQTVNSGQLESTPWSQVQFTEVSGLLYVVNDTTRAPVKSTDGGQMWQPLAKDPTYGGAFYLYANPSNHNQLLVSNYTTLFFSNDGGTTWQQIYQTSNTGAGIVVGGAYFNGGNIYVGTSDGLLVSSNGGSSFALSSAGGIASGQEIVSLAGATQNGVTRLFVVTAASGAVYGGMRGYDAYTTENVYSLDVGSGSWVQRQSGLASTTHPFFVSMAANNISTAYLAGATDGSSPMVYKTTDGGNTWQSVFLTANNQNVQTAWEGSGGDTNWSYGELAMGFTVSPTNPNEAILSDYGFAYKTTDGGATWQTLNVAPASLNPAGSATPVGKAYQDSGLDDTTVWGVNWADANHLIGASSDIHGVVSADGGTSWSSLYQAQPYNTMDQSVTAANGTVYAAMSSVHDIYQSTHLTDSSIDSGSGAVMYSTDKGATWQTLHNFGHPVVWVATDATNPNRLYASVVNSSSGGIYITNDLQDGANSVWTELAAPPRTQGHPLDIRVLNDGTLVASYSGRRDSTGFTASSGVFISTDSGQTWQDRSAAGMQYWTQDVIIDPNDPTQSTWYAGVYGGWGGPAAGLGGLYKTTDRGQTWTRIFTSDGVSSAAISPTNANEMYVATEDSGLWYTSNLDSGATFTHVASYPFAEPLRVFYNPYNTSQVWVSSFGDGLRMGTETSSAPAPLTGTPTATITGPATAVQGQTVTYALGAMETGAAANASYTFKIDWNGDGTIDQTITGASGTQVTHTFTTAGADTVAVTATDAAGATSAAATIALTVSANQPTATISGPASGTSGQGVTFTVGASEPYATAGASYTYRINWGDGSAAQTVSGPSGATVAHTFATAGSYTVTMTATDSYGNASAAATTAITTAAAPQGLTAPVLVSPMSGGTVTNPMTVTWQPAAGASTYQLEIDDFTTKTDYVVMQSGLTATSYTAAATLTAGDLYRLMVRGVDAAGHFGPWTAILFHVAPPLTAPLLVSPASGATVTNPMTVTWQPVAGASTYQLEIDDFTTKTDYVVMQSGLTATSYTAAATLTAGDLYRLMVRGVDAAGHFGPWTAILFHVAAGATGSTSGGGGTISGNPSGPAVLAADPTDATKTALIVNGTAGNDTIVISPTDAQGTVQVVLNGANLGTFLPTGHIIVYGGAGDDTIQLVSAVIGGQTVSVSEPAMLFGQDGYDTIDAAGGSGNDVLVGGDGNDVLNAGTGRDLLIGDAGADSLSAHGTGDIEIGGTTDFDTNLLALNAIMAEWGRTDADYNSRVNHLTGAAAGGLNGGTLLNANTVHDDQVTDYLSGNWQAIDWFFAHTSGGSTDQLSGAQTGAVVTPI